MRCRVYVTVGLLSVRLSVCPFGRQQQQRPAGLLLSALRTGEVDRSPHGALRVPGSAANASNDTFTADMLK